jgi:hypothetical protein
MDLPLDLEDQTTIQLYEDFTGAKATDPDLTAEQKSNVLRKLMVKPHLPTLLAGGAKALPKPPKTDASKVKGQVHAEQLAHCKDLLLRTTATGYSSTPGLERVTFLLYKREKPVQSDNKTEREYALVTIGKLSPLMHQEGGASAAHTNVSPYSPAMHARRTRHVTDPETGTVYSYPLDIRSVIKKIVPKAAVKAEAEAKTKAKVVATANEADAEAEEEEEAPIKEKKHHKKKHRKHRKVQEEDEEEEEQEEPRLLVPAPAPEPLPPPMAPPLASFTNPMHQTFLAFLRDAESRQQRGDPAKPVHAIIAVKRAKSADASVIVTAGPPIVASFAAKDRTAWAAPLLNVPRIERVLANLGQGNQPLTIETRELVAMARLVAAAPQRLTATLIPPADLHQSGKTPHQGSTLARAFQAVAQIVAAAKDHPLIGPPL